jgi:hypothetical protein
MSFGTNFSQLTKGKGGTYAALIGDLRMEFFVVDGRSLDRCDLSTIASTTVARFRTRGLFCVARVLDACREHVAEVLGALPCDFILVRLNSRDSGTVH